MTTEQKQELVRLGWGESHPALVGARWDLKLAVIVRLKIKAKVPHKEGLYQHLTSVVNQMDINEVIDLLRSEENLDALAATILLTQ